MTHPQRCVLVSDQSPRSSRAGGVLPCGGKRSGFRRLLRLEQLLGLSKAPVSGRGRLRCAPVRQPGCVRAVRVAKTSRLSEGHWADVSEGSLRRCRISGQHRLAVRLWNSADSPVACCFPTDPADACTRDTPQVRSRRSRAVPGVVETPRVQRPPRFWADRSVGGETLAVLE